MTGVFKLFDSRSSVTWEALHVMLAESYFKWPCNFSCISWKMKAPPSYVHWYFISQNLISFSSFKQLDLQWFWVFDFSNVPEASHLVVTDADPHPGFLIETHEVPDRISAAKTRQKWFGKITTGITQTNHDSCIVSPNLKGHRTVVDLSRFIGAGRVAFPVITV